MFTPFFLPIREEPSGTDARTSREIGLSSICITDHMDYDFPDLGNGMNFEFDPRAYIVALQQIRPKFPNLEIRQGVELGLKDSALPQASALINNYDFDFVIGSTHLVDNTDPYYDSFGRATKRLTESVNTMKQH